MSEKEPLSNIFMTCPEHAARPNPVYAENSPESYIGKYCKIGFTDKDSPGRKEHMWVKVDSVKEEEGTTWLVGVLDNDPVMITEMTCGDAVEFTLDEIEDVYTPDDAEPVENSDKI